MSGYGTVLQIQSLERRVDKLGLRMGYPKYQRSSEHGDQVALYPKDDCLPVFTRDAELFVGSLDGMRNWLDGWEKCQEYYHVIMGKSFDTRVKRKEQDYRNETLMQIVKGQEVKND